METLFTFLFKYRPAAFARGALALEPAGPWWVAATIALGAAVLAATLYARSRRLAPADRVVLTGLRGAALLLLAACLAGPVLLIATAVPQRNIIAVLVDRSPSMGVADDGRQPRLAAALAAFGPSGTVSGALAGRFQVRTFAYADATVPLTTDTLSTAGLETDLAAALDGVRERLAGQSLAGVVVVTDGGNTSPRLTESLLRYRASGIPIHTVGLGAERVAPDVGIEPVALPARVLRGSAVMADVRVAQRGFAGRPVTVTVEDEGGVVGRATARLPGDGEAVSVPVSFTLAEPGPRRVRVRVTPLAGERVAANNVAVALVDVVDREARLLYMEGEPRFEVKFLRRAVADDRQLHVSTLLRTADEKYLRLDVTDSTELPGGFPRTRAALYAYEGLVLGSVEASLFTRDQLRMIADFVRERGGGLLVLGGRRAFAGGGYARTPVADALPVDLPDTADTAFVREIRVERTPAGRRHPALKLGADDAGARWDSLPPLTTLHPVRSVKPGAVILLTGSGEEGPYVVLASQRYGRGRAAAFNVQDSWLWQMDAGMALEDQTHETLWRQLLRWLVAEAPAQVSVRASRTRLPPGRPVTLTAEVADSAWGPLNGAEVTAEVRQPDGESRTVALAWSLERDGAYRGIFTPDAPGRYEVVVDARAAGRRVGSARAWIEAGDPGTEFLQAGRQTELLRRVARETGGGYYTAETAARLPEDAPFTSAGATMHQRLELWDMPAVLVALLVLLGAEWTWRRARGLS